MKNRQKKKFGGYGCGFLVATCIFTCCMLVVNIALVRLFYPYVFTSVSIKQAVQLTVPVGMLFPEWWLADLLVDLITSRTEAISRHFGKTKNDNS